MEFETLNLNAELKKALLEAGYLSTMPVQEKVIELGLDGRDLYVQSQTGTGKTAAFLIVIFHRLMTDSTIKGRKALIMAPTRELAVQIEEEAKLLARYLPFKIGSFYGGVGYGEQQKLLREDAQILIGTPGRVLDLNQGGEMSLMDIAFLVLDEADRMFDMGFYPDLRRLIKVVPPSERRQTMLFSATLNVYVKNLALEYTNSPLEIEIEPEHITVDEIEQVLYHVPSDKKFALLLGIMRREEPESAIIFCNTKRYTEVIAKKLRANGINCEFISGDLPQKKRLALINGLKDGRFKYLVATDVAARGLDVEGLSLVVNYDLPSEDENYVHRIGRTARAGAKGKAFSFASEQDVYELIGIERFIGQKIPSEIASEELYAEDISRFSSRSSEGRDGGGFRERQGGRAEGRGRKEEGRAERPEGRGEKAEGRVERRREDGRGGRAEGRRERPEGGWQHGQKAPDFDVKLASMTSEERMAYYKEKYCDKEGERTDARARGGSSKMRGNQRHDRKRRGKQAEGARQAEGGAKGPREGGGKPDFQKKAGKYQNPRAEAPKKEAAPAKKGIFSRIVSIFKKKS